MAKLGLWRAAFRPENSISLLLAVLNHARWNAKKNKIRRVASDGLDEAAQVVAAAYLAGHPPCALQYGLGFCGREAVQGLVEFE